MHQRNQNNRHSMSNNATHPSKSASDLQPNSVKSHWLALPAPLRHIFDTFPLVTYEESQPPQRVFKDRASHILHLFVSPKPSANGSVLSPNPACLKWQAYLTIKGISFQVASSSNHASPSGALPYLQPALASEKEPKPLPIVASKIQRWMESQGAQIEEQDIRLDAYMALVDHNIRNAWLYYLYVNDANFAAVASKIYIEPVSSSKFVRLFLTSQLKEAAKEQLLKTKSFIDEDEISSAADVAFQSLDALLGNDEYFSKTSEPGLFDCSVFAYTYPILSLDSPTGLNSLRWQDSRLADSITSSNQCPRLVDHYKRMLSLCTGDAN